MDELGIIVCTYNRWAKLARCLDGIARLTRTPHRLLVVDDGSTDETLDLLKDRATPVATGQNRGIAWNKNRGLFYFTHVHPCRAVILVEDDCCPLTEGWERDWIEGARIWGHVNHAGPTVQPTIMRRTEHADDPLRATMISGQCASFSSEALSYVGYLDTRFKGYGHEHVEHTMRCLRAGYGGRLGTVETDPTVFYVVEGGITASFDESYRTEESVQKNAQVFDEIRNEPIHRQAWRTDEDFLVLREEMRSVVA